MRILVTGGAGFIGSHTVERIVAEHGAEAVRVLDDLSTGSADNLTDPGVELVIGCVTDAPLVARLAADCDAIVHLAAIGSVPRSVDDPVRSHEVNANGTLNVLEAARRANAHVVFASSSAVYGSASAEVAAEDVPARPMTPYAASKLTAEAYLSAYAHAYRLRVLPFRFFNVYGPRQTADHDYAAVVPRFIRATLTGDPLHVHGDGLQTRDFVHVDTVAAALTTVISSGLASTEPINLAFGTQTSVLDVVDALGRLCGSTPPIVHESARVGDVRHSRAEHSRLTALLPDLRDLSFEDGLSRTVQWYRTHLAAYPEARASATGTESAATAPRR